MKIDRTAPWLRVCMQSAWLGFEAQQVIALRLACFAAGGSKAQAEASRMVTEKFQALADGQVMMLGAALRGEADAGAEKRVSMYRRRVRANRTRLSRA